MVILKKRIGESTFYVHQDAAKCSEQLAHELQWYEQVPLDEVPANAVCSVCKRPLEKECKCNQQQGA